MFSLSKALAALTIALTLVSASTASAYERWMNIHNVGSGSNIVAVYITHIDMNSWGNNLIWDAIPAGYYQTVEPGYMQGYCRGDIRVEFGNGKAAEVYDVNVCEETDYEFGY
jgi:hypothetical protein